jgi:hypothetical protein
VDEDFNITCIIGLRCTLINFLFWRLARSSMLTGVLESSWLRSFWFNASILTPLIYLPVPSTFFEWSASHSTHVLPADLLSEGHPLHQSYLAIYPIPGPYVLYHSKNINMRLLRGYHCEYCTHMKQSGLMLLVNARVPLAGCVIMTGESSVYSS